MFRFYYTGITFNLFNFIDCVKQNAQLFKVSAVDWDWRIPPAPWLYLTPVMPQQAKHCVSLCFRFISANTGIMLLLAFIFLFRLQASHDTLFIANCFYGTFHNHSCELMTLFDTKRFSYFVIFCLPSSNWETETPHIGKTLILTNLWP